MFLMTRDEMGLRLRVNRPVTYNILRSAKGVDNAYVAIADVLAAVNYGRRNMPPFTQVPDEGELLTAEETCERTGVKPHDLALWTHRKRDPIPHIHLSNKTLRFVQSAVEDWLARKFGVFTPSEKALASA